MPDPLAQALATPGLGWLALAVCVAGMVRGFSGFGSAMIIMPVASSVLSPVGAIVFLTMTELFGPLPNLPHALREGSRADVMRLGIGALIAIPFGVFSLSYMSPDFFGWVVSAVVLLLLVPLISGWRYHGQLTPPLVMGTGALGGFLSGSTGMPGPPVIMLYMASSMPVSVIRANFLLYLLMIDVMMIAVVALFDLLELVPILVGLLLVVPYMLSNIAGAALFRPGAERLFRAVAYLIIAASAILGLPLWT